MAATELEAEYKRLLDAAKGARSSRDLAEALDRLGEFAGRAYPQERARTLRVELTQEVWPEDFGDEALRAAGLDAETVLEPAITRGRTNPFVIIQGDVPIDPAEVYQRRQDETEMAEMERKERLRAEVQAKKYPFAAKIAANGFVDAASSYHAARAERREFLVQGWIPAQSDVALGAEYKAGKSWIAEDLVVSCTAGVPFLGQFPVSRPLKVAEFVNEAVQKEYWQHIDAIAEQRGVNVVRDVLPRLRVQFGASVLSDPAAVNKAYTDLAEFGPDLIIVDPWYLSAGDADGKTISTMGTVLRNLTGLRQELGASLLITAHWNQTGAGNGFNRWSGAGLQEWGRTLINVYKTREEKPKPRRLDPTGRTEVRLSVDIKGQVSGAYTFTRSVWRDDRDDLNSPMRYVLSAVGERDSDDTLDPVDKKQIQRDSKFQGIRHAVLRFIVANDADPVSKTKVKNADGKKAVGVGTRPERLDALATLQEDGLVFACMGKDGRTEVYAATEDGHAALASWENPLATFLGTKATHGRQDGDQ